MEGDDAGHIPLERQDLEVEHEAGVIRVRGRNADGAIQIRKRIVCRIVLGFLNAALDLANTFKILIEASSIGGAQSLANSRKIVLHEIEQARAALERCLSIRLAPAFAEEPAGAATGDDDVPF